eukprot:4828111-Pleurochrysis_carterae.AAC.1
MFRSNSARAPTASCSRFPESCSRLDRFSRGAGAQSRPYRQLREECAAVRGLGAISHREHICRTKLLGYAPLGRHVVQLVKLSGSVMSHLNRGSARACFCFVSERVV